MPKFCISCPPNSTFLQKVRQGNKFSILQWIFRSRKLNICCWILHSDNKISNSRFGNNKIWHFTCYFEIDKRNIQTQYLVISLSVEKFITTFRILSIEKCICDRSRDHLVVCVTVWLWHFSINKILNVAMNFSTDKLITKYWVWIFLLSSLNATMNLKFCFS